MCTVPSWLCTVSSDLLWQTSKVQTTSKRIGWTPCSESWYVPCLWQKWMGGETWLIVWCFLMEADSSRVRVRTYRYGLSPLGQNHPQNWWILIHWPKIRFNRISKCLRIFRIIRFDKIFKSIFRICDNHRFSVFFIFTGFQNFFTDPILWTRD